MQAQTSVITFQPRPPAEETPTVLLVPGVDNSGPTHWQSYWQLLAGFERVEFSDWRRPKLHDWVPALDRSIRENPRPVVLAAHSLGCLAVAWWASLYWSEAFREKVCGALLVAPPDVDRVDAAESIRDFRPSPTMRLPFPGLVVASENDPYASLERSEKLAESWGCKLVEVGRLGHINAASGIAEWAHGLRLLSLLTGRTFNQLAAELSLRAALA